MHNAYAIIAAFAIISIFIILSLYQQYQQHITMAKDELLAPVKKQYQQGANPSLPKSFTVKGKTFNFSSYQVTLAEQENGLMNSAVNNSTFMLFIFNRTLPYPFWMKDTYYNLDIIWLKANATSAKVVYFANATPCVKYNQSQQNCPIYIPDSGANYILETSSNFASRVNLHVNDTITFNYG